jgi:pimeloyl-ACP methyl ester carboxylesterase
MKHAWTLALMLLAPLSAAAQDGPTYGPELEGFDYPYPVTSFAFRSQGKPLTMAYMDVPPPPNTGNGRTAVLLHGKNFCAATWEGTIKALSAEGYRVIAPDQIGFCKSTKPEDYQYSFHQLAANTRALLDSLNIERVTVMGHSMGGMLATRFALLYPEQTEQLVMVNPIGLEDWRAKGVPYQSIEKWNASERETSADRIRAYQKATYYAGEWKPEYDKWVEMQAGLFQGSGRDIVAWNSALTYDMIYTQPVFYEFEQLRMPVLMLIGEKDNTAIGKALAPAEMRKTLGIYAKLGKEAADRIPGATLVTFEDLGHSPQIQAPERFHEALLKGLAKR